ncbi:uncharacterized protein LOC128185458 [Crassostrea angulata]|uniref:uncharacterized protein LOC128185457 n=1 Tax=Magallana angulata TaxID=2784310 RepID=UPI0022B0A443|nr:uncharacterized protein LOC128185457 [Crassostrea angulata]XP_052711009.1 uncharacterized protein LOC128185458 [Crassostrea angulata]
MALSMTAWAREITGDKTGRTIKTLPLCAYTDSKGIERLATFSALSNYVIIERIYAVRLASSGCIFNAEQNFVECTECGKITALAKVWAITTLFDVRAFHTCRPMCCGLSAYNMKQEREERERIRNDQLSYSELVERYGIVPRQ